MVVGEATRNAWGPQLGEKLGRLYESAQSTLVTQQAFELRQRATLIGLNEDYAAILPSLTQPLVGQTGSADQAVTSTPRPAIVSLLRETLERHLEAQTGKRVPGKRRARLAGTVPRSAAEPSGDFRGERLLSTATRRPR